MADALALRQKAAQSAEQRMLSTLMDFTPAEKLTVSDVKFIASWCRSICFDAIKEVDAGEARP